MTGMEWIRLNYGVPASRGGRVRLGPGFAADAGREGAITSSLEGRLRVRLDGDQRSVILHPTWEVEYLDA